MARYLARILMLLIVLCSVPLEAGDELYIMCKYGSHPPQVVTNFEKETGIRVRFEYFQSSEEIIARLNAGSKGDLFLPRGYAIPTLVEENRILPLDHAKLPNLKNLWPIFYQSAIDPGRQHSVPYMVGNMGILYRQDLIKQFVPSWGYFFNPANHAAPFTFLDYYRDTIGAALIYLGYSYNSEKESEIYSAIDILTRTTSRPAFFGFVDSPTALTFLEEGFVDAVVTFNGDAAKIVDRDPRLDYVAPEEGSILWSEDYVISRKAKNTEAVYRWLNYILDPKVGAEIAEWTQASSPNQASREFMSPMTRQNQLIYPQGRIWDNTQVPQSVGPATNIYLDYWSRLKKM